MWFKTVLILSIVATGVVCTNHFINIDNIFTSTSVFYRDHGYALIGHVIKTLNAFMADCMSACHETLSCFSFNYIDFHNGTFLCELNRSNKKQNSGSYIRKEDYEYAEPTNFQYCDVDNVCVDKDALPDDWYKFNTSLFKLIHEKKTWNDARTHCQSLGGDLASIGTKTEEQFINEVVMFPFGGSSATSTKAGLLSRYAMNGQDGQTLSLQNGAAIVDIDGTKALYFDGVDDYATIPSFEIRTTDFTIALWIKIIDRSIDGMNVMNDVQSSGKQFTMVLTKNGNFLFSSRNADGSVVTAGCKIPASDYPINTWNHITVTWNRSAKQCKIYVNATLMISVISTVANVDLYNTGHKTYELGGNDLKNPLKGWIRQLAVFSYTFKQQEVQRLSRLDNQHFAAWGGLNDKIQEGVFKWSDNQPLTYTPQIEFNSPSLQCGLLQKKTPNSVIWSFQECSAELPFICEKH